MARAISASGERNPNATALPRPGRPQQITSRPRLPGRTGGHPGGTHRLNHDVEESHDDLVHHALGLDRRAIRDHHPPAIHSSPNPASRGGEGLSLPLDSDAVSEAVAHDAGDRIYDCGPASSPRSCCAAGAARCRPRSVVAGQKPSSAANSRSLSVSIVLEGRSKDMKPVRNAGDSAMTSLSYPSVPVHPSEYGCRRGGGRGRAGRRCACCYASADR
jgi:hypothetical protein